MGVSWIASEAGVYVGRFSIDDTGEWTLDETPGQVTILRRVPGVKELQKVPLVIEPMHGQAMLQPRSYPAPGMQIWSPGSSFPSVQGSYPLDPLAYPAGVVIRFGNGLYYVKAVGNIDVGLSGAETDQQSNAGTTQVVSVHPAGSSGGNQPIAILPGGEIVNQGLK